MPSNEVDHLEDVVDRFSVAVILHRDPYVSVLTPSLSSVCSMVTEGFSARMIVSTKRKWVTEGIFIESSMGTGLLLLPRMYYRLVERTISMAF